MKEWIVEFVKLIKQSLNYLTIIILIYCRLALAVLSNLLDGLKDSTKNGTTAQEILRSRKDQN